MSAHNDPAGEAEDRSAEGKSPSGRRIFGTKRLATPETPAARPELEEKLANLVDSVKVLQSHIAGGKPGGQDGAEPEPKQRRMKRFQRAAGEDSGYPEAEPVADSEARDDQANLNKNIAWPRLARTDAAPTDPRIRAGANYRRNPTVLYVLAQISGLALLLVGYWFGQSSAGDEATRPAGEDTSAPGKALVADPLVRVGVNDRALDATDHGLQAEKSGDVATARQTWESAVAGQVRLPGAAYRLAMLDIQRGDLPEADIHLSASLATGEMMASCYFVNACFAGKKSNYVEAARQIANAVRVEPFNAKFLFCWGEALRRAGKSQGAIEALNKALDRPASPADRELFSFKLRLAKLQAGQDDALDKEITDQIARTPAAGDWLLVAAARDLGRAAFPAAAGHLRDAARVLTPEKFDSRVQDFVFQGYVSRPELATLLQVPPPAPSTLPMDPGAWQAEEADPAVWPPFSPAL